MKRQLNDFANEQVKDEQKRRTATSKGVSLEC